MTAKRGDQQRGAVHVCLQRSQLARSAEIWQFNLLSPHELSHFAAGRGIALFNGDAITNFWCAGLIRADLITAEHELEVPGAELVSVENDIRCYCDQREVEHKPGGTVAYFLNLLLCQKTYGSTSTLSGYTSCITSIECSR